MKAFSRLYELDDREPFGPRRRVVTHLVLAKRPWLYTLATGVEAAYTRMGGGMAMHLKHPERLRLQALCSEITGIVLAFRDGGVENRASHNATRFDCEVCRVSLDRALKAGRVQSNDRATLTEVSP